MSRLDLARDLADDVLDLCRRAGLDPTTAPEETETLRRAVADLCATAALEDDPEATAAHRADVRAWERERGVSRG